MCGAERVRCYIYRITARLGITRKYTDSHSYHEIIRTKKKKKIRQSVQCTYIIRNNDMNKMKTEINLPIINQDNIIIRYVCIVKK